MPLVKPLSPENNLEVNSNVDERYHIEKSTEVACDYLNKAKNKFGNWTLAAASYNAGMYGISKKLEEQLVNDYYDLLEILKNKSLKKCKQKLILIMPSFCFNPHGNQKRIKIWRIL